MSCFQSWIPIRAFRWRWILAAGWLLSSSGGHGAGPSAVWDLRYPDSPQPPWMGPVVSRPVMNLHVWRTPIRPSSTGGDLAVTFVFRQIPGGYARVIWQGPGRVMTICANLFEQAAPLHQRTLLLPRSVLGGEGQLFVESSGSAPCLERVDLVWVEPRVSAAAESPGTVLLPSGRLLSDQDLRPQAESAPSDRLHPGFVDAVLEPGPLFLSPLQTAEFSAPLQGRPGLARMHLQISGLAPDEEPRIWVNGNPVSAVSVETPRLDDPGFRKTKAASWSYGGWRNLAAFLPAGWLQTGENRMQISAPPGAEGIVLRDVRLEIAADSAWTAVIPVPAAGDARPRPVVVESSVQPCGRLRPELSSRPGVVGLRPE